jgi:hypothetical protein
MIPSVRSGLLNLIFRIWIRAAPTESKSCIQVAASQASGRIRTLAFLGFYNLSSIPAQRR